jgi:acyl-CoA synthetase (NDP forming)
MLSAWDGCDAVINLGIMGRRYTLRKIIDSTKAADPDTDPKFLDEIMAALIELEDQYVEHVVKLMERDGKPILGVSLVAEENKTIYELPGRNFKGVFFPSPERAVKALSELCTYDDWLDREEAPHHEAGAVGR